MYGVCKDNGVSFPDLCKISEAYDIPYTLINSIDKTDSQLSKILSTKHAEIIEVIIDPEQFF